MFNLHVTNNAKGMQTQMTPNDQSYINHRLLTWTYCIFSPYIITVSYGSPIKLINKVFKEEEAGPAYRDWFGIGYTQQLMASQRINLTLHTTQHRSRISMYCQKPQSTTLGGDITTKSAILLNSYKQSCLCTTKSSHWHLVQEKSGCERQNAC